MKSRAGSGGTAIVIVAAALSLAVPARAQGFRAAGNADPNHRASPHQQGEVVVTFDTMPTRVSFDLPGHIKLYTENGIPYINGATETYIEGFAEGQSYESWNDTQNAYSRMWIESASDARIVVRHRCALVNKGRIAHAADPQVAPYGPGNWVDEWYTFHPDGTHVRRVKIYTSKSRQSSTHDHGKGFFYELEGMYLWWGAPRPGTMASDHLEDDAMTLVYQDGRSRTIDFTPYPIKQGSRHGMAEAYGDFKHASISVVNTKSEYRPWRIGRPSESGGAFWEQTLLLTPYRPVHKLVQLVPCFPANTTRQSGYSVAGLGQVIYSNYWKQTDTTISEIWLNGFVRAGENPAKELATLARSWQRAPRMGVSGAPGARALGYDVGERAFLVDMEKAKGPGEAKITIAASRDRPVVNPCFLVNGWGKGKAALDMGGKEVRPGKDLRFGHCKTLDLEGGRKWKDVLVVWAKMTATERTRFTIRPRTLGRRSSPTGGAPSTPAAPKRDSGAEKAERLYKVARQAERLGQRSAAAGMYERVVKDYPGTPAAAKAAARLKAMGR